MLNERNNLYNETNIQDSYIIDMVRGIFVDSRAMSEEQYARYFRTYPTNFVQRPDLNPRQAA